MEKHKDEIDQLNFLGTGSFFLLLFLAAACVLCFQLVSFNFSYVETPFGIRLVLLNYVKWI